MIVKCRRRKCSIANFIFFFVDKHFHATQFAVDVKVVQLSDKSGDKMNNKISFEYLLSSVWHFLLIRNPSVQIYAFKMRVHQVVSPSIECIEANVSLVVGKSSLKCSNSDRFLSLNRVVFTTMKLRVKHEIQLKRQLFNERKLVVGGWIMRISRNFEACPGREELKASDIIFSVHQTLEPQRPLLYSRINVLPQTRKNISKPNIFNFSC